MTYLAYANYRRRMTPGPFELTRVRCRRSMRPTCSSPSIPSSAPRPTISIPTAPASGHASALRPLFNFRPSGRFWNFSMDLCLIDWLEAQGIAYDVVSDHDLHEKERGAPRALSRGHDGQPPGILHARDAPGSGAPCRNRRAAHVYGRQRALLAGDLRSSISRPHRAAPRRGRNARLGRKCPASIIMRRASMAASGDGSGGRPTRSSASASSPRASTPPRTIAARRRPTIPEPPSSSPASRARSSVISAPGARRGRARDRRLRCGARLAAACPRRRLVENHPTPSSWSTRRCCRTRAASTAFSIHGPCRHRFFKRDSNGSAVFAPRSIAFVASLAITATEFVSRVLRTPSSASSIPSLSRSPNDPSHPADIAGALGTHIPLIVS